LHLHRILLELDGGNVDLDGGANCSKRVSLRASSSKAGR
jgi:hypothetical protein